MSRERPFLSHFSPQWTDPKYLEDILVQRGDLLAESVSVVRNSVLTDQRHHLLFIGPRGAGKTHLVTLIQHRLSQDAALKDRMRVAWLNEDETATSFLRLLIAIYRSLSERYPEEFPAETISKLAGKDPSAALEQLTCDLLRDLHGRIIVCLMENLDSLFRSLSVAEQRNWRAFLQNHPVIVTVGTAQALFDGIADQDEPFYGFFDTRHLKPLSVDEARDLLARIAVLHGRMDLADFLRTPTGRARVDAIRALAGGNPRLYLIFSDLLVNAAALDDLVRPFEEMVDRQLTSYYQERLRWLSPQQREIVQFLCRASGPVPVKHIADGLFTSNNSITGQLRQLREFRYVDSHPLGREVLYELAEPLMRLALQVKETHDRRPLTLIVDFLRIWHEQQELADRLARCPSDSPARSYLENANRLMLIGPNLRYELFRRDLDLAGTDQCDDVALEKARAVAKSGEAADLIRLARILNARKEWEEATRIFTVLIEGDKAHSVDQIAWALVSRGAARGQAGRTEEAIADWTRVIELPGALPDRVAWALLNRGVAQGQDGRDREAIADYTRAIDLSGAPPECVASSLLNRGVTQGQAGRVAEEIADYTRAIELPGAPPEYVARALASRGGMHGQAGRVAEEIADYTRAIELPGAPPEQVALALISRGATYGQAGRTAEGIADYTRAIELPAVPPAAVAAALVGRGVLQSDGRRGAESIADLTRAIEMPETPITAVAVAHVFRGIRYITDGRYAEAIADLTGDIELPGAPPEVIARVYILRGTIHSIAGRTAEAIAEYTRAIELPDASPEVFAELLSNRASCHANLAQHQAVLRDLGQLFTLPDERASRERLSPGLHKEAQEVVTAVFAGTTDPARWVQLLTEFTGHFARFGGLTGLGEAAVKHLPTIGTSPLNHAAWDAWADAWESARAALPAEHRDQLDIPLRLLRAGIAWLKSKDDAHLLTLPREERRILREALELPAERV
jgi:tetratricopeptide (TPR) repeat protein